MSARGRRAWIARSAYDTWRLCHAIFRGGWFDPANTLEAWTAPCRRVVRGGSWNNNPQNLRSANRNRNTTDNRNNNNGFRVGSTLSAGAGAITVAPGALLERPGPSMMSTDAGSTKFA